MVSGKYLPLSDGTTARDAVDPTPDHLPVSLRLRYKLIMAILGILCFVEGAAMVWWARNAVKPSWHPVLFQNEAPFGNITTDEEVELAWSIYGLRKYYKCND